MAISTLHHLFTQACMSRRAMSERTAQVVYAKSVEAAGLNIEDAPSYSDLLDEINTNLEPYGFTIKRFQDEFTGRAWIAFCNAMSDEIAKVATEYGPGEISYFRQLIKLMMRSGKRYAIKGNEAKNAGQRKGVVPKLTAVQAQAVLSTFVAHGWLVANTVKRGSETSTMYSLSARARMELEHYLTEEYPEQTSKDFECKICNELVMRGFECSTANCNTRMHEHCGRSWLARQPENKKICPKCRTARWNPEALEVVGPQASDFAYVGDSEDSEDEDQIPGSDDTPPPPPSRPPRSATQNDSGERSNTRRSRNVLDDSNEDVKPDVGREEVDDEDSGEEADQLDSEEEDPIEARKRATAQRNQEKSAKRKRGN